MTTHPARTGDGVRRPPLRQQRGPSVVEAIKQYIVDNRLSPGDAMPTETAICEDLGVSRPSVREALRTLQSLDIVEIRHGRGMRVGSLSLTPMIEAVLFRARLDTGDDLRGLQEVVDVRIRLDISVAEELAAAYEGSSPRALHELVDEMREHVAAGEPFPEADEAFHNQLLSVLDNQLFTQINNAFWQIHSAAVPLLGLPQPREIEQTANAHLAMLEALERGDADAYREAVIDHYGPLQRLLDEHRG